MHALGHLRAPIRTNEMASAGQTSTQAMHSVHRGSITWGRRAAGISAPVGQVARQAPQAVQPAAIATVISGTRGA
jgi:hypothetical protein